MFSTSGSSLIGIYEGFRALQNSGLVESIPSLHAVQAGGISSLADLFQDSIPQEKSEASNAPGSLGVKNTARKEDLAQILKNSGGSAWWADEEEIEQSKKKMANFGISTSLEGAACFASARKAALEGRIHQPLIILTGHISQIPSEKISSVDAVKMDSYNDLRIFLDKIFGSKKE
jgi:threonine synthase